MIPTKITMRNFLRYADSTLVLEELGSPLLIVGRNGAGKSTLLHALTWALWEKTPTGLPSEKLVRWGASDMEVSCEFLQDNQRYRVRRTYSKVRGNKRDTASFVLLEVQDGNSWNELGSGSAKATQPAINTLLKLDYPLFATAAYLAQRSRYDFASADPAERTQLLASILGLDFFEQLAALAKTEAQLLEVEGRGIELRLQSAGEQLGALEAAPEQLKEAGNKLTALKGEVSTQTKTQAALQETLTLARSRFALQTQEEARTQSAHARLAAAQAEVVRLQEKTLQIQQRLEEANTRSELAATHTSALNEFERLSQLRDRYFAAREQAAATLRDARDLQVAYVAEVERVTTLEKLAQTAAVERETLTRKIAEIDEKLSELDAAESTLAQVRANLESTQEELQKAHALVGEITAQGRALTESISQLADAQRCPTCLQDLAGSVRDDVLTHVRVEQDTLREKFVSESAKLRTLTQSGAEATASASALEKRLQTRRVLTPQRQDVATKRSRLDEQVTNVESARAALAKRKVPPTVVEAEDAPEVRAVGFDANVYERMRAEVARTKEAFEIYSGRVGLETQLEAIAIELSARESDVKREQAFLDEVRPLETVDITNYEERAAIAANTFALLQEEVRNQERLCATLESDSVRLNDLKKTYAVTKEQQVKVTTRKELAAELVKTCGKKGVPWMIVRRVLPELEEEANEVLGMLSDGQLAVEFCTEEELKNGALRQTMRIDVLAEGHRQDYDACSAGQAFKVTFALRIALSRLLARRAGAKLQVLCIDEGFGTQDEESRPRLVEAIKAVAPLFARILVITHFPEIKEAFPHRLEVVSDESGSRLEVA